MNELEINRYWKKIVNTMTEGLMIFGPDGTIVFMWTRPIKRRAIYLGRLFAAQIVSTLLMSGSLALCFMIMVSEGASVITFDFLKLYVTTFLIIGLGAFTYSAVFAAMGTFFKKPVLPAILLVALASLVLGMGVPVTAAYLITAVLAVPPLTEMGVVLIAATIGIVFGPVMLAWFSALAILGILSFPT